MAFTDEEACQWRWLRSAAPDQAAAGWEAIPGANERVYRPSPEDLGRRLRVECTPVRCCHGMPNILSIGPLCLCPEPDSFAAALSQMYALCFNQGQLWVHGMCRRSSEVGGASSMGEPAACEAGPPVAQGPPLPAGAARHALTAQPLAHPGLRVVTYNILADQYAATEYAREHLFSYCPARWARRAVLGN